MNPGAGDGGCQAQAHIQGNIQSRNRPPHQRHRRQLSIAEILFRDMPGDRRISPIPERRLQQQITLSSVAGSLAEAVPSCSPAAVSTENGKRKTGSVEELMDELRLSPLTSSKDDKFRFALEKDEETERKEAEQPKQSDG